MTTSKTARNRQIAADYRRNVSMADLARQHGLSQSRVSYILKQQGARLPAEEQARRQAEISRARWGSPEGRARMLEGMAQASADGRTGRPTILSDDPDRREDYLTLRDACGAEYAREVMGI